MNKENRLVVADIGWAESIPEWIKEEIKGERMINGIVNVIGGEDRVGNAEVVAYLYTASLRSPMSNENNKIYLKLSGELMKKRNMEIPDFMNVGELDEYEKGILEELRDNIKRARGKLHHPLFDMLRQIR